MKHTCVSQCLLLLLFFSCRPKTDFFPETAKLDSALTIIADAQTIFQSFDTIAIRQANHFISEKIDFISSRIAGDTIYKKTAVFLTMAYKAKNNFSNITENKSFWEKAISESSQRIENLKHDLEKSLMEKNKANHYAINELNAAKKIHEAISILKQNMDESFYSMDSLKIKLTALADSLNRQYKK